MSKKVLLSPVLFGFLAGGAPLHPVPEDPALNYTQANAESGYVTRLSYFSRAEMRDKAWEKSRRYHATDHNRDGCSIIRRDVRWFPATRSSGEACASAVYSFACGKPTAEELRSIDQQRLDLLREEPDRPIEKQCGDKRPNPKRLLTSEDYDRLQASKAASFATQDAHCANIEADRSDRITLYQDSHVAVIGRYSPDIETTPRSILQLSDTLQRGLARRAFMAGRLAPIAVHDPARARGPHDILITHIVGGDQAGAGYCVRVTAQQGNRLWRRTIQRASVTGPGRVNMFGYPFDPEHRWNDWTDSIALGDQLATHVGLPFADLASPSATPESVRAQLRR